MDTLKALVCLRWGIVFALILRYIHVNVDINGRIPLRIFNYLCRGNEL